MSTTSPLQAIPLPDSSDAADVPYSLAQAFGAAEKKFVMVFASSAARASAIPAPTEGMVSWLQDTNLLQVYDGTAWQDVTYGASAQGAWQSYPVAWTATTTNPTLGNGTLNGYYNRTGKTIRGRVELTMGSTTAYGSGSFGFSLPVPPKILSGAGGDIGQASLFDTSTTARAFRHLFLASVSEFRLADDGGATATATVPWTWASGDSLVCHFLYEAS